MCRRPFLSYSRKGGRGFAPWSRQINANDHVAPLVMETCGTTQTGRGLRELNVRCLRRSQFSKVAVNNVSPYAVCITF